MYGICIGNNLFYNVFVGIQRKEYYFDIRTFVASIIEITITKITKITNQSYINTCNLYVPYISIL